MIYCFIEFIAWLSIFINMWSIHDKTYLIFFHIWIHMNLHFYSYFITTINGEEYTCVCYVPLQSFVCKIIHSNNCIWRKHLKIRVVVYLISYGLRIANAILCFKYLLFVNSYNCSVLISWCSRFASTSKRSCRRKCKIDRKL